ncbi:MAG: 4-aminobutyrate--2-oxoglutarate transaminase [Syntrophomonadaceae bacterium]|nr:4-aminobutyrate--2-oxoglutarate transaminase [Syntrophomonadaceae bacterium]
MKPGIITELPGPKSKELLALKERYVARGYGNASAMFAARAEGALVQDLDGNVFLDFAGGLGILNTGHCPSEVVQALKNQLDQYLHTGHIFLMESYVQLAARLAEITPGPCAKKVLMINSGAEAVENAVKIARKYTQRTGVIALECGFHGRTYMAMTLTSKVKPYKAAFSPLCPEVYRTYSAYCYRCPFKATYPGCGMHCLESLERLFVAECTPENIAAIIVEPVQGEGGFVVLPQEFLVGLKQICERYGIVFIADEIQTGFARTGRMFACEHFGLEPDLMAMAKSLGAGLPIAAVVGKAEIVDAPEKSEVGSTFGGSPLGCVAGLAVIDKIQKEDLVTRAQKIGAVMQARLREMQERYSLIGDVRGLGAMVAIELVKDRQTREPAAEETSQIISTCYQKGLTVLKAGLYDNVIRFLVPLVISEEDLNRGLNILEESLDFVTKSV